MTEFKFESSVLKWAREKSFGPKFDVLTERWVDSWDGVSPALISDWEKGTAQPSFIQIKTLAKIYKRPLSVFFLDEPPDEKGSPPDLRTIGSKDNKYFSPEALLVIRKARRTQENAADLLLELNKDLSFKYKKHSINEDPSQLGEQLRSELSISDKIQFTARKSEDFFEYLRMKIESTGVITLKSGQHDSFSVADCRAFSFADQFPYLILVNNKDSEYAKNFSLIHEFAHLLLREAGICNNFKSFEGSNPIEVFCNQFAASFLVPESQLLNHRAVQGKTKFTSTEIDNAIDQLTKEFKVSRFVILRRFLSLNVISHTTYQDKVKSWGDEPLTKHSTGGSFSLRTTLLKNGVTFSALALEAYRNNKISYAGLSDYLGLKTKHLPAIERLIEAYAK